jgi:hypothetical protein
MSTTETKTISTIPVEDWERIVSESDSANKLLNSPDFSFLRDYLHKAKESAIMLVATNQVHDVLETTGGGSGMTTFQKTIKTTKEEQISEIAGCIKFIDKLFSDLEQYSKQKDEYLKLSEEKKINIEVTKENAS